MLEETLSLFVEATGKDEASMRQQLMSKRPEELRRNRELWKTRVEEKQRFHTKKKGSVGVLQKAAKLQTKEEGGLLGRVQAEGDEWTLQRQQRRTRKILG